MERVAQAIIGRRVYRSYSRMSVTVCSFADSIGYRISPDDGQAPLFYGEVKIDAENRYHVIPALDPAKSD